MGVLGTSALAASVFIVVTWEVISEIGGILVFRVLEQMKERERIKGAAQIQSDWMSWNQRRMQAEADEKPFNEPPPSSKGTNGTLNH